MNQTQEQDVRLQLLNAFLSCPHRDTDQIKEIHQRVQQNDPVFYAHLASWYKRNGEIRDHIEIFCSLLSIDPFLDNREVGLGLFQQLPIYLKGRVLGFIKGKEVKIREKTGRKKKIGKKSVDEVRIQKKTVGLFKNPPTAFKKEVEKFLRYLEADNDRFDSASLRNAKDLKGLYASLKIRPSARANSILFKKKYPEDSKMNVLKQISEAKSPAKAAELIVQHKVPYTTAVGLIDKLTPSITVALINNMSPQELLTNIASLEARGALDNAETKKLIEAKLEKAQKSKNVSALKSKQAKKTGRIKNEEIAKKLDQVADVQVKKRGVIKVPTAIFVDRSGSMSDAIEMGKQCAVLVSGATEAPLYVLVFDNMPREIRAQGKTLTDWEKAFASVRPGGNTSIGCPLQALLRSKIYVDQIVIITDGGENATPFFHDVYREYVKTMNVKPSVVIIQVGGYYGGFESKLTKEGIEVETYKPDANDYYGLPGLIPLLSRKSKLDLLMEILETPLVKRKEYKDIAPYPEISNRQANRKVLINA